MVAARDEDGAVVLAWAAKKADIIESACSAADDEGTTAEVVGCEDGPARPRDRDIEMLPSCTPSKSGMLGGWYFVASPAACKQELTTDRHFIINKYHHSSGPCSNTTHVESNMHTTRFNIASSGAAVLAEMLLTLPFIFYVLGVEAM